MTYTRINPQTGVREFSQCLSIKLPDGRVKCDPTAEEIAAQGWVEWIPPVIPPQPQTEPSEYEKVTALNMLLATDIVALDDESAIAVMALFPTWVSVIGTVLHAGERYYYDERLWKVLLDHTAQIDWTPSTAHSLFVKVSIVEWPEWVQPVGSTDAYNTGDKVSHNDQHWTSDVDGNVWEPGVYGWTQVG